MSAKTYNKMPEALETEVTSVEGSNPEPFKQWTGFDSFWAEFSKETGANPKWKNMVKDHIEKLGWLKEQRLWKKGCAHFGIQS